MKSIVFWGASGHAKVLNEFIEGLGYKLVALFDNSPEAPSPFAGVPIYHGPSGFARWRATWEESDIHGLVAIGGARGRDRHEIQRFLQSHGVVPVVVAHPTAFVAKSAVMARGTQVLANASICADVSIGEACIINTGSNVDHESSLGDGVHVAPGATLAGCVSVGPYSLIGVGAVVLPRIRIGEGVIIGGGAVVTKDVPDRKVVYGNPARIRRDVDDDLSANE